MKDKGMEKIIFSREYVLKKGEMKLMKAFYEASDVF